MKKRLALWLCILMVLVIPMGCAQTEELTKYETSFMGPFDTYTSLILYAPDADTANVWGQYVYDELNIYHELFDIYNLYEGVNNLSLINQVASVAPVEVDERLMDMLLCAKEMAEVTDGHVNIAMGSVLSLWHEERTLASEDPDNAKLPDMEALQEASLHMNIDDLILDVEACTVYFADPSLLLDVGATAKGYAVARIEEGLREMGVTNALLSVGGNIYAIGGHSDGSSYRSAIQNPDLTDPNTVFEIVPLVDQSLVTSGDYQRYYTVDGMQYHHIIDPVTLMPTTGYQSISIVSPDSAMADALSTALFTMTLEEGQALVASLEDVAVYWILSDGTTVHTDDFPLEN